ncbi:MAG: SH3 domain-containing protein [Actinophytocola sp.]|uniref:SH3 domain-containing protein n=1 Tax=Actinophytocola sp. TaxID=1872138 RepID=UPI003D6A593F
MKIKWSGKRTLIAAGLLVGVLWLYAMGSEQRRGDGKDGADTTSSTTQCRVEATVDDLNIRSAPALNPNNIVGTLDSGDQADAQKVEQNGFRKLDEGRWVSSEYVVTVEGRDC